MKKKSSEVWVGIFVVIGILLLALLTMKVEKFHIRKDRGYLVNILFDSAAGLDRSAEVRVAGVHVGNVEKVLFEKHPEEIAAYAQSRSTLVLDFSEYYSHLSYKFTREFEEGLLYYYRMLAKHHLAPPVGAIRYYE